jgi:hypothetical protein
MALFKVTAPTPDFTGEVAGVAFAKSVATVDSGTGQCRRAVAYFRRKGYQVEPVSAEQPDPEPHPVVDVQQASPPARSASKADWVAYATSDAGGKRFAVEDAEKLTRDQLAEKYLGPKED